ncbi:MAG: tetratricopeptide repeat protein [Bacteroidaceae bacterium]|nr:tetratricopeptide repeat protein [Bacteroidaceae bacterium]
MKKSMIRIVLALVIVFFSGQWSMVNGQSPKWADKARQAVFSVVTYDNEGKMLGTGNGFFVSEGGAALSDYALFKGASRAEIVNAEGKRLQVLEIMGANEMYDVLKFKVALNGQKATALTVSANTPVVGSTVYLLPYSTQKKTDVTPGKVKESSRVSGTYQYYTLELPLQDKMVSCPLMDANGQVFALAQQNSDETDKNICYAIDARFAMTQEINALSLNDGSLSSIGIKKALPDTEDQALVTLYMASTTTNPDGYAMLLNDFVAKFPGNADGYVRRATHQLSRSLDEVSLAKAEADLDKALEVSSNKGETYYERANLIYNYQLTNPEQTYKDWTFEKALGEVREALATNDLPAYDKLEADILFAMQRYDEAYQAIEKVNNSALASESTWYSAAHCKELMNAPADEVIALMDKCIATFTPPFTEAAAPYLLERARILTNAEKYRPALVDYDEYFKAVNGKVNDQFYYLRGQCAMQAKAFQRALDDYAEAIEQNPDELTYRAELAVVNMRVGRNDEAVKVLDEAIAKDAAYAELYRLKGLALLQQKKNKDARTAFDKAKELGDPQVDALIEKYF